MKIIRYINNQLIGVEVPNDYDIKTNEIQANTEVLATISNCIKPVIINSQVVESATSEEIAEFEKQKELEAMKAFKARTRADGQAYYDEIDIKITAQFFGRPQSEINPLVAEVDEKVMPVMNLVKDGQWYSAMMLSFNTPAPVHKEVLAGFEEIKQHIINYVQQNYNKK